MTRRLTAYLDGHRIGQFTEVSGRVTFTFDDRWRQNSAALEISLSLPKALREHRGDAPINYLWGLLPDNEQVLQRWGQRFGVNHRNPMALLEHVGLDAAGAIQLSSADSESLSGDSGWDPLTSAEIADHLRALRDDHTGWLFTGRHEGRSSLAGAQAKFALARTPEGWSLPTGRAASTHIVKPGIVGLQLSDLNEHLHLAAARHLGLVATRSSIEHFDDESAIVVERYDRESEPGGSVRRIHQEDLVQATGLPPTLKYQADGGPGIDRITQLLHDQLPPRAARGAIAQFFDAVIFNWIVAGPDAHAKNYSLLHTRDGARLAPLYDVAGVIAYSEFSEHKLKLAMSIAGRYRIREITPRHIADQAERIGLDPDDAVRRATTLAASAPDAFADSARRIAPEEHVTAFSRRLVDGISARAGTLVRQLRGAASPTPRATAAQVRDAQGRFRPKES